MLLGSLQPPSVTSVGPSIMSVHTRLPQMNSGIKFRDTRPAVSVNRSISWPNRGRGGSNQNSGLSAAGSGPPGSRQDRLMDRQPRSILGLL